jgi:hypothetical protein
LGVTTVLDMFSDETTFAKIKRARAADLPNIADIRSGGAALVRAAHAREKLAIVHVTTERDARLALGAGVGGLAHFFIAESSSRDFGVFDAGRHAFVIPTLEAFFPRSAVV